MALVCRVFCHVRITGWKGGGLLGGPRRKTVAVETHWLTREEARTKYPPGSVHVPEQLIALVPGAQFSPKAHYCAIRFDDKLSVIPSVWP